jgi:hypothetical protein
MRFAYADPPYLGCARKLYGKHHEQAAECDDPEWHRTLISRLSDEYPDGWALSLHSPSLQVLLPMCPPDVRVCAWVKPFAVYKPNVNPAYAWEPVIVRGGRKRTRSQPTTRDWVSCNITLKKGLTGAKPAVFCFWLFDALNIQGDDVLDDLFPGSGAVPEALAAWRAAQGPAEAA